jgi:two-component system copper resistance phosphate regulon response regulator CusR
LKVLIIEDETKLASILVQGLKENGFLADTARDGMDGLMMALERTYDAIILDVMLPGRNGFEILRSLRETGSATPVLMLTARSAIEDRVRGLDLGADDYLPKPFAFKELLARLRAITRRPQVEPQTLLRVADLELDPRHRKVHREGQVIELTTQEFALLEFLMRNQGTVLTRTMIMDQVWASDDGGRGSNVVEVYINYLRKKIDQPYARKLIHTVRGTGYLLGEKG